MKRMSIIVLWLLMLASVSAGAAQDSYIEYGDHLIVNAEASALQIPVFENKYMADVYIPSDEAIMAEYDVTLADTIEDDVRQFVQRVFKGEGIKVYSSNDGRYIYQAEDYMTYYTLLYYCVDPYDNLHPDWMLQNTDELDFMTAEAAGRLIEDALGALFADVLAGFDFRCEVYPAHAEDMRAKVTSILAEECQTQDDLDFFKRKHGMYEGCIGEGDDCYFVEGHMYLDDLPVLPDSYYSSNVLINGMRLRAIINKDGLLYMSIYDAIYISGEEQQAALQPDCEELLTKVGAFLDNILGIEPFVIDRVELIYAPYPVALRKYELTPMLSLSAYDAENDAYVRKLLINAITGELLF